MSFNKDLDEAEHFTRVIRPDLAGQTLHRPDQGREHFTFLTEGEAVRIARNDGVAENMGREADYLSQIDTANLSGNFPALIDYQPEHNMLCSARIPGSPLTPERLAAMPEVEQKAVGEKIGILIGDLHLQGPQAPLEINPLSETSLSRIYEKMASGQAEDGPRLEQVDSYVQGHKHRDYPRAMIHNDLGPGNILYDENTGRVGFIDFSNVRPDFAHTEFVTLLKNYGEGFTENILDGYRSRTRRDFSTEFIQTALDTSCMVHLPQENFRLPPPGRW